MNWGWGQHKDWLKIGFWAFQSQMSQTAAHKIRNPRLIFPLQHLQQACPSFFLFIFTGLFLISSSIFSSSNQCWPSLLPRSPCLLGEAILIPLWSPCTATLCRPALSPALFSQGLRVSIQVAADSLQVKYGFTYTVNWSTDQRNRNQRGQLLQKIFYQVLNMFAFLSFLRKTNIWHNFSLHAFFGKIQMGDQAPSLVSLLFCGFFSQPFVCKPLCPIVEWSTEERHWSVKILVDTAVSSPKWGLMLRPPKPKAE